MRASPAIRSASAAPPWTRTSVPGERRTCRGPDSHSGDRRSPPPMPAMPQVSVALGEADPDLHALGPLVEAGEAPRGLRVRREGAVRGHSPGLVDVAQREGRHAERLRVADDPGQGVGRPDGGPQSPRRRRVVTADRGLQATQEGGRLGRRRLRGSRTAERRVVRRVTLGQPDHEPDDEGQEQREAGHPPTGATGHSLLAQGPAGRRGVSQDGPRRRTASCRAEPRGSRPRGSRRSRSCRCRCTCRRG